MYVGVTVGAGRDVSVVVEVIVAVSDTEPIDVLEDVELIVDVFDSIEVLDNVGEAVCVFETWMEAETVAV